MSGRKEDAVYGLLDLEIARQHREELLREAHEGRIVRTAAHTAGTRGERTAFVRRLLRFVWRGGNARAATAGSPGVPVCECSAD